MIGCHRDTIVDQHFLRTFADYTPMRNKLYAVKYFVLLRNFYNENPSFVCQNSRICTKTVFN
jgi:hypothetical protein